jgi:acetyl-CoA carboxylase biotin carboxyl carrier protein
MMNSDEIKEILEMMREHDLAEFELERDGLKIRLKKQGMMASFAAPAGPPAAHPPVHESAAAAPPPPAAPGADRPEPGETPGIELAVVKSPIVGTFYRASEPGAPSLVEIGDIVRKGQVLCIIEAMKLMNEIESEHDGEMVSIYVENGLPVQYGERLFAIKVK